MLSLSDAAPFPEGHCNVSRFLAVPLAILRHRQFAGPIAEMSRRQPGFTRASALGPIASVVEGLGGSIGRILQDVDLPLALLERRELVVPLREQFRLLERAARATGDEHFGARLGSRVKARELNAFGRWVCAAADPRRRNRQILGRDRRDAADLDGAVAGGPRRLRALVDRVSRSRVRGPLSQRAARRGISDRSRPLVCRPALDA